MKVIITYASAGVGHFKAAQAIYDCLQEQRRDIDIKLIDILSESNPFFRFSYIRGYNFLVRYAIFFWKIAFWTTHFKPFRPFTRGIAAFINQLNTKQFARLLIETQPDFIVSTHFLPSEIAASLKLEQKIKSRLITVVTDFGVHSFWISPGTDMYIVASGATKSDLIQEGIEEERVKDFGIPINARFLKDYNRSALLKKFNLQENKFTVLIMTGSFGIGPIEEIVDLLYREAQILVVCAKNKRLYAKLKKKNYPGCTIFGYIDNVEELMAASDMMITKPGALSISESLVMDLLPVFVSPIPGQETENIRVLSSYGIGSYPKDIRVIRDMVIDFKRHPEKLKNIKETIAAVKKPSAARDIANVIR